MGGFVKVGFNPIPVSRSALDGGYVRALAVTSSKHSSLMPDLPTLAEAGLLGFDATLTYGLLAPADTPRAIVDRLNKELRAALASDEVRARIPARFRAQSIRPGRDRSVAGTAKFPAQVRE